MKSEQHAGNEMEKLRRFLCPSCGKHTVLWLLPTTTVKDLPIKCKRCGKESIVNIPFVPVP